MSTVARTTESVIPPLTEGERLSRAEFERRYDAMPGVRAELIEGIVHMASPVHFHQHGMPHAHLMAWIGIYKIATPGVWIGDNTSVRLDDANEPQPDAVLFVEPDRGGQVRLEDGILAGAPELVAEVSASTKGVDLGAKFRAYRRNGVREYLVWRVLDRAIDWFVLRDDESRSLAPDADGLIKSQAFPGLWLDAEALAGDDLKRAVDALNRGLASPEHAAFVERLKAQTP